MHYRNSDFKHDTYFKHKEFRKQLSIANHTSRDTFINEVRKINNSLDARRWQGDIRIQDILIKVWPDFKVKYMDRLTRPGVVGCIENFISCHNPEKGFLTYICSDCGESLITGLSCHSRMCPSCGKKYRDQRSIKVSEKVINVPHRQFVFSTPFQLRPLFRKHRELLGVLLKSVNDSFTALLKHKAPIATKKEQRRLGLVCFLHTFGRDLKWHPHVHVLIAERYIDKNGILHKYDYFAFEFLRITFQNVLFHHIYHFLKEKSVSNKELQNNFLLMKELKKLYPKGYYVYGPKNDMPQTITGVKALTNYIVRYASHPAISERRIESVNYIDDIIRWYYDPHEDDNAEDKDKLGRQYVEEPIASFLQKIILHIPNKGFQQIRYYGFYANAYKTKGESIHLFSNQELRKMNALTKWTTALKNSFGYDPLLCRCGGHLYFEIEYSYLPRGPA